MGKKSISGSEDGEDIAYLNYHDGMTPFCQYYTLYFISLVLWSTGIWCQGVILQRLT